ncbi:MAG: hydrogenase nickel incorporation protein HypA [Candidatus Caldatribacteriota bacterium]|jgi:hydrogenase nickel incorporation protein HypA/HybF|nr:hydrogenase nickel incorporation protein HypA [Atribacterota bacterium]
MHEWSLAEAVLKSSVKEAKKRNLRKLLEVKIVLGELQGIEEEIVKFGLDSLKKGTIAEEADFIFINEKATFKCRNCQNRWTLKEANINEHTIKESIHFVPEVVHSFIRCPRCGSPDFEVVRGRGIYIKEITGEDL